MSAHAWLDQLHSLLEKRFEAQRALAATEKEVDDFLKRGHAMEPAGQATKPGDPAIRDIRTRWGQTPHVQRAD